MIKLNHETITSLKQCFDKLDQKNQNGYLDQQDFSSPFPYVNDMLKNLWKKISIRFDQEGDCAVSFREFVEGFVLDTFYSTRPGENSLVGRMIEDRKEAEMMSFRRVFGTIFSDFNTSVNRKAAEFLQVMETIEIRHKQGKRP